MKLLDFGVPPMILVCGLLFVFGAIV